MTEVYELRHIAYADLAAYLAAGWQVLPTWTGEGVCVRRRIV